MPRLHPDDLKELGEMVSNNLSIVFNELHSKKETLSKASTFNVQEVANIVGKHPTTILHHIKNNILKATKPGKSWIVSQKALNDYTNGK